MDRGEDMGVIIDDAVMSLAEAYQIVGNESYKKQKKK